MIRAIGILLVTGAAVIFVRSLLKRRSLVDPVVALALLVTGSYLV